MMQTPSITVIVTIFNQSESSIEKTLKSVACQEGVDYQLILADDHSEVDSTEILRERCKSLEIPNFKVIRNNRNLKTVGNILAALGSASGRYSKAMGAGDELYDPHTLEKIVDFCDEHGVSVGFGNIVKDVDGRRFRAPKNDEQYPPLGGTSRENLFAHQLAKADWVPGGSQFFKTGFMVKLLGNLQDKYDIKYCEDFAGTIALMDTEVFHLDEPILVYEWGGGISTNGSLASRKRLYDDHLSLYRTVAAERAFERSWSKDFLFFKIRRFVALKTPIYGFFQRRAAASYTE